ncbi:MAG: bifunctional methionine sulfoxide reductase B/A protein [Gammaproteobacteria bacterium]
MNKIHSLTPDVLGIVRDKGTEPPAGGEYNTVQTFGTYCCRQCGLALFRGVNQFHSGCGWPSFDEEISATVSRHPDVDGVRTEITCFRCNAHLGHVFHGENITEKNTRHCVNSLALDFIENEGVFDTEEAIFAAGCFWGVQALLKTLSGVLKTEVGYCGGDKDYPSYEQVCKGDTGHLEAVRVLYDPKVIPYKALTEKFFELHDPAQHNGQGPDIGTQYLSAIFYYDEQQRQIAESLIALLKNNGVIARTQVREMCVFWKAEAYHQEYYLKTGGAPYCHRWTSRF